MNTTPITPVGGPPPRDRCTITFDDEGIANLITLLLERSGLSEREAARRMGVDRTSLREYRWMKRKNPSIKWVLRYVLTCGGRLWVELPSEPL